MARLIQIGNSYGVRIPKTMIEQANLANTELVLKVLPDGLLISPQKHLRAGWAESFQAGANVLDKTDKSWLALSNKFDEQDWEW